MVSSKDEFRKTFLPESVTRFEYTHINIDNCDLSISDILRNINKLYPLNSRDRMDIESGTFMVGVLCRSNTLFPYKGLFILISSSNLDVDIASSDYIVMTVSENRIRDDGSIESVIEDMTGYLINNYSSMMRDFKDFYRKYVYDESEIHEDDNPIYVGYQSY